MRNLLVRIKYDGSGFCGWQVQNELRTVQSVFQAALRDVLKENVMIVGCSRTDSGVHANERSTRSCRRILPPLTAGRCRMIFTRATAAGASNTVTSY